MLQGCADPGERARSGSPAGDGAAGRLSWGHSMRPSLDAFLQRRKRPVGVWPKPPNMHYGRWLRQIASVNRSVGSAWAYRAQLISRLTANQSPRFSGFSGSDGEENVGEAARPRVRPTRGVTVHGAGDGAWCARIGMDDQVVEGGRRTPSGDSSCWRTKASVLALVVSLSRNAWITCDCPVALAVSRANRRASQTSPARSS